MVGLERDAKNWRTQVFSLLNRPAYFSQMLAEGVARIGGTPLEIAGEIELLAERPASPYRFGLAAFALPDLARDGK